MQGLVERATTCIKRVCSKSRYSSESVTGLTRTAYSDSHSHSHQFRVCQVKYVEILQVKVLCLKFSQMKGQTYQNILFYHTLHYKSEVKVLLLQNTTIQNNTYFGQIHVVV